MKKITIVFMLCFAIGLTFYSCGNSASDQTTKTETTPQPAKEEGKEFTSAFICPMHCTGSGSDTAGKCPVCRMDYVANDKASGHEGHDHEGHNHEGHNHGHDHDHDHGHQH